MPTHALLETPSSNQTVTETLEQAILRDIDEQAVIGMDALIILLPGYSWNQIFHAVDRLARCGKITLRRHRSEYTIFSTNYAA
jgi:hypothetical protein